MNRRIISSIAPLLLFITFTAAFSVHPINTQQHSIGRTAQLQTPIILAATEGSDEIDSETTSETADETPKVAVKCPDCDLCDGSGRILGGIGVVLDWWPIKAYRPCPNFIERGGRYVRSGQGLDEIAFGRDSTFEVDN
mmetsp:Transcript_16145/g.34900  ORF Transcript_16145/g.34900 Transcript_16145/m.34900 type:complete len:138 (-) Transcript_16145:311-724(-)|eukprot:CAMPEP_0172305298 /NCGR_PEP_ID=MMETSP1058-20130122/6620_1 /TAXON_ID=83371 /ORGANISM="Detonula confervacea, Strain CCMP 353" /LENGTH=137 /DNA_ID=CAMNT_0013016849 /DNA_START=96 /DNA_END=509 /DNA_ORIENTATION=+